MRVLMTRKSCAVGMRNAILRNYLKFPVVDKCTFFSRLRYTMQRLSEGLAGILLVVRHLFHKTGFKLHVRRKHGGRTIDEEGMISIA